MSTITTRRQRARASTPPGHRPPCRRGGVADPGARRAAGHFPRLVGLSVLHALEHDLGRRFGADTHIVSTLGPAAGLAELEALARGRGQPVALLIVDQRMPEMTGVDFLAEAHALHHAAKRMLLVTRDYTSTNPIIPAMTLGQIDYHLVKPWLPELGLYPAVSDASRAGPRREARRLRASSASSLPRTARAHTRSAIC